MAQKETTLSEAEIAERLAGLPGWTFRDGAIRRTWVTDGWAATMLAVNAVAWVCEAADHHPDLAVSWGRLEVALHTHSAGGITGRDLETAALIERTLTWRPAPGDALSGRAKPLVR